VAVPRISIYTTCKNNSSYLQESLDSILAQSFTDFEIVLVDSASTDATLDLLQEYRHEKRLKWISEPDSSPVEGYYKALSRCSGQYIMCLPISDKYIRPTWFAECIEKLDADPDLSLVHGNVQLIDETGADKGLKFPKWETCPPPDKEKFFAHWLALFTFISEISYCVRAAVYRSCYPVYSALPLNYSQRFNALSDAEFALCGPHLKTLYNFHQQGYLSAYIPVISSAAREHSGSLSDNFQNYLRLEAEKYRSDIIAYREQLLQGQRQHYFRDGQSQVIAKLAGPRLAELTRRVADYRQEGQLMFGHFDVNNCHCRELTKFFMHKCTGWKKKFSAADQILIYGGGQHTEQLCQALQNELEQFNIIGIVDRSPVRDSITGIPVFSRDNVDWHTVDRVIISSKAFEEDIYHWLVHKVPAEKIEMIYNSLAKG